MALSLKAEFTCPGVKCRGRRAHLSSPRARPRGDRLRPAAAAGDSPDGLLDRRPAAEHRADRQTARLAPGRQCSSLLRKSLVKVPRVRIRSPAKGQTPCRAVE